jgi:hypothetical protein
MFYCLGFNSSPVDGCSYSVGEHFMGGLVQGSMAVYFEKERVQNKGKDDQIE